MTAAVLGLLDCVPAVLGFLGCVPAVPGLLGCRPWRRGEPAKASPGKLRAAGGHSCGFAGMATGVAVVVTGVVAGRFAVSDVGGHSCGLAGMATGVAAEADVMMGDSGVVVTGVVAGRFAVTDVDADVMGDSGDDVTHGAPSRAPKAAARDVCVLGILRCARVSGLAGVTRPGV